MWLHISHLWCYLVGNMIRRRDQWDQCVHSLCKGHPLMINSVLYYPTHHRFGTLSQFVLITSEPIILQLSRVQEYVHSLIERISKTKQNQPGQQKDPENIWLWPQTPKGGSFL